MSLSFPFISKIEYSSKEHPDFKKDEPDWSWKFVIIDTIVECGDFEIKQQILQNPNWKPIGEEKRFLFNYKILDVKMCEIPNTNNIKIIYEAENLEFYHN